MCPTPAHSSLGGAGGSDRVVTRKTGENGPGPTLFTACTRSLLKRNQRILIPSVYVPTGLKDPYLFDLPHSSLKGYSQMVHPIVYSG